MSWKLFLKRQFHDISYLLLSQYEHLGLLISRLKCVHLFVNNKICKELGCNTKKVLLVWFFYLKCCTAYCSTGMQNLLWNRYTKYDIQILYMKKLKNLIKYSTLFSLFWGRYLCVCNVYTVSPCCLVFTGGMVECVD